MLSDYSTVNNDLIISQNQKKPDPSMWGAQQFKCRSILFMWSLQYLLTGWETNQGI